MPCPPARAAIPFLPTRLPLAVALVLAVGGTAYAQAPEPAAPLWPRLKYERALAEERSAGQDGAAYVRAQRIEGSPDDALILIGDAEVRRGGTVLRGDRITYTRATDEVKVEGNARVARDGAVFAGPSLRFNIDAQTGEMPQASYSYAPRRLRGESRSLEFLGEGKSRMTGARMTTCQPGDEAWWVKAERIDLDDRDRTATTSGMRIVFQDVPIMAAPWFAFPIGDERKSGFLTPRMGVSSTLGVDVSLPYYFNLAPNYDYTLTPRLMTKRGLMVGNEFRYLLPTSNGKLLYDVLPHDRETGEKRDAVSLQTQYSSPIGLSAGINYNRVSDDKFLTDFSTNIISSSQTVLPQEAFVAFGKVYWNTSLRVTKNQTLTLPGVPFAKPYEREPQATLTGYLADWNGLELRSGLDSTRFVHPNLPNGTRTIAGASAAYPYLRPGWFVIPKASYMATWYSVDPGVYSKLATSASRYLPIASLDSGMIFERNTSWFDRGVTQTLEPRLYYAYIPYRDQSALPNFDSALSDFNFAQLFTENVYSGYDRIGDANQLSATVTTRLLDDSTGEEWVRAAIGQRYYFSPQQVTLPGIPARAGDSTDLLFGVTARVGRQWTTDISAQYSTQFNQWVRNFAGVRWQPRPASVVGVYYRYQKQPGSQLDQIDATIQWPITNKLYAVGRYNYSLLVNKPIEALAGFEYKADCWVFRAVAQRFTTSAQTQTSSFYVQLELNGLGGLGVSPLETLRRNIPGYQTLNPLPENQGRYQFYE